MGPYPLLNRLYLTERDDPRFGLVDASGGGNPKPSELPGEGADRHPTFLRQGYHRLPGLLFGDKTFDLFI